MEPIKELAEGVLPEEITIDQLFHNDTFHKLKEPIILKYSRTGGEFKKEQDGVNLEWESGTVIFPQGFGANISFPKFLIRHAIVKLFSEQIVDSITTPEDNNHIFKSLLRQNYNHLQAEIGFNG